MQKNYSQLQYSAVCFNGLCIDLRSPFTLKYDKVKNALKNSKEAFTGS
ncbi:hypothetical protein FHS68_000054 [Dyadobacter arcticus]|uniref:Uncharacterized protein n=1 Tax=Dyadobacter arcticus TaxID=1078754 RepID=A0ABX0UD09_9BACT|nr:hypothetical protein [Dyadobacter arcticus]